MAIKLRTVRGLMKKPGFIVPHAITLTAISTPNGKAIELECEKISMQVAYADIVSLMEAADKNV